jgi:hypothetical protein
MKKMEMQMLLENVEKNFHVYGIQFDYVDDVKTEGATEQILFSTDESTTSRTVRCTQTTEYELLKRNPAKNRRQEVADISPLRHLTGPHV